MLGGCCNLTRAEENITVASYCFENYHPGDPRNDRTKGPGRCEWGGVVKDAKPRVLTMNCWNEWTEGSYLEPDTVRGMKYFEAIRDVFGVQRGTGK